MLYLYTQLASVCMGRVWPYLCVCTVGWCTSTGKVGCVALLLYVGLLYPHQENTPMFTINKTAAATATTVVVYTCGSTRSHQPTNGSSRVYYGFSSYEGALRGEYGEWVWETTLELLPEWEESFSYSSGGGDRAHGYTWGYSSGWYEYSHACITRCTLVSAPGCH